MTSRTISSRVSQAEIAAEAGVARTTVSLALRGGDGLTPETVERVQQAAARLGYRPNRLVHGLRSGRTGLIGVMVPPHDTFWSEVLYGIHDGLVENEYVPLVLWSNHRAVETDEDDELKQVFRLVDWRVDAAILWPWFANLYQDHIHELTDRDMPVVTVDCRLPSRFGSHAVLSDESTGAAAAAKRLTSLGHRNILHLAGPEEEAWSHDRREEFERAAKSTRGAAVRVLELPLKGELDELIREVLGGADRPSAVFAATDHMAEACYRAAQSLGLSIPKDLSVIGCGDLEGASRMTPPLTTIRQQPYEMGRCAAQRVVQSVGANPPKAQVERMPMVFVDRESVAAAPGT